MADIILRADDWMGGTQADFEKNPPAPDRHFFRGKALVNVNRGDRVYFVAKGSNPGEGAITGYAKYQAYERRWGMNMTEEGWLDAYVVTGPYVPIDPPEPMTDGYRGQWRARYVHTVHGLDERLRRRAP